MEVYLQLPGLLSNQSGKISLSHDALLINLLKNELANDYRYFFKNDTPQGFILIYLNDTQLNQISEIELADGDRIEIISAQSGG